MRVRLLIVLIVFDEKINNRAIDDEEVEASAFIDVKSHKAKGKRLTTFAVKKIKMLDPLPYQPEEEEAETVVEEITETVPEKPVELPSHDHKPPIDDDAVQMTLEF